VATHDTYRQKQQGRREEIAKVAPIGISHSNSLPFIISLQLFILSRSVHRVILRTTFAYHVESQLTVYYYSHRGRASILKSHAELENVNGLLKTMTFVLPFSTLDDLMDIPHSLGSAWSISGCSCNRNFSNLM
jgi:hypothetical protein